MSDRKNAPETQHTIAFTQDDVVPFESTQEAWFWFITAQQARNDGARIVSGAGSIKRPCEPVDILKILDNLYRTRRLVRDHLLVLRHYGRRHMPPERDRAKEKRAYYIWSEAMERLEAAFEKKGIVKPNSWVRQYSDVIGHAQSGDIFDHYGVAAE